MQTLKVDLLSEHPRQRQFFKALEGKVYQDFLADVYERGILQALIVSDRTGELVVCDGHQRLRAALELGFEEVPVSIQHFSTEFEEVRCLVLNNVRRRQLSREEISEIIGLYLRENTIWTNKRIGDELGVSKNTVEEKRRDLETGCQIDTLTRLEGADGKMYPRSISQPRATPVFRQVVNIETGEISNVSDLQILKPDIPLFEANPVNTAPFPITVHPAPTPLEGELNKRIRRALTDIGDVSASDWREHVARYPESGPVLLEIMVRISEALELKRSNIRTITVDAKAVN